MNNAPQSAQIFDFTSFAAELRIARRRRELARMREKVRAGVGGHRIPLAQAWSSSADLRR